MRRFIRLLSVYCLLAAGVTASAASGKVIKVLPHFLDLQGRHTLSPSLFDRDAYQAILRAHPERRSGIRFDVHWKARGNAAEPLKLYVELRGTAQGNLPRQLTLVHDVKPGGWFGRWTSLPLAGDDYKNFGEVTAWRATLWEGNTLLGEQKSFLW